MGSNYLSRWTTAAMTKFISEEFHSIFLGHLKGSNKDFGLIVDETTGN